MASVSDGPGLPLSGLRVLDLTRALAGPFCTMILGDLGADVIKVEPTPEGEMARGFGPHVGEDSLYFAAVNRNKRSLALDFRSEQGASLLREVVHKSDILVENFKPGVMDDLGLSYETLSAERPDFIYASVTGFGSGGPYESWPGLDQIAQGMSGLMSVTGHSPDHPLRVGIPLADVAAGMWCAIGVLAAAVERNSTGKGQRVETSLLGGLIGMLCVQGQRCLTLGEVPKPAGNDHPVIAPYGVFQASDGPLNIAAPTDAMWRSLCRALDLSELLTDERFGDGASRFGNRDALRTLINERLRQGDKAHWTSRLVEAGVPAGPVLTLDEVFSDPHVVASGRIETIRHPTLGSLRQLASPVSSDRLRGNTVRRPPPLVGEHSVEILRQFGFSDERIDGLRRGNHVIEAC